VLAAAAAGLFWLRGGFARRTPGPIIFVSIDTLRADHLPAYGYDKVRTPAIDALAADGVLFERAYAHVPQTLPSHASILSGLLPFQTGVRDNVGFAVGKDVPLLPEMLRAHGYATGGVVSSYVLRAETGIDRGFDFYDSKMPEAAPDQPIGQIERPGLDSLKIAERWMSGLRSPRFFLFFHIYEPHRPYDPPARFKQYAPYDGEIAFSDEIVGNLFDWLKARGWYDSATIVLFSDHGEGLGDHGEQEHGLFLYDSTIRVPLVIKLPGERRGGARVSTPVEEIDLVPTVLDLIGAPRAADMHGRSLRGLLDGTGKTLPPAGFYAEALYGRYHYGWSELYALTDARYRYIKAPRPELYDLDRDPAELTNLAPERPQTAAAMRGALDRILSGATVSAPGAVSAEARERLQALGYIGAGTDVAPETPGESLPDPKDKVGVLEQHRQAVEFAARREYDKSIAILQDILHDNPDMKDLWLQLGVEQVRMGRLPAALEAFKHLVTLAPSDGNGFVSVASVLYTMGRLDEAEKNARAALELPDTGDRRMTTTAYEVLVRIALARHDAAAARREAAAAAKADPTFPLPTYVEAMIHYQQAQYREALPLFQETIKQLQAHTVTIQNLYYDTGDTLAHLGEAGQAEEAFRQEIGLSPANVRAHAGLAILYRSVGRAADADAAIADLLRTVPTSQGYAMAIRLRTIFGETARAAALRQEAVRRFGEQAVAREERALLPGKN
jgi:arylsulfatase A-like enzyme/cytochrome c-type biogenesis protein CcmH/NrfG